MVFASQAFLAFLVVVLAVAFVLGRLRPGAGKDWIIAASLFFYGYWEPAYLLLLAASIGGNYVIVQAIFGTQDPRLRSWLLTGGVVLNIGLLGYFKYFAFIVESINVVGGTQLPMPDIVLPIALSFCTFQQIGLLVDAWQGRMKALDFRDHVFLIVFFPHLIAGPILSQHELMPQLAARRSWALEPRRLAVGGALFAAGLFKKTVLIDPFARHVDAIYAVAARGDPLSLLDGWAAGVGYGFQIYFDFSGYSDMALGLAFMLGISLPLNFFSPYKAASIRVFWRSWHITLSRFLQRLVYIPLGGSRHGMARTVAALVATMAIGGLWHGAGWNFVIWGLLHGMYLACNHVWIDLVRARFGTVAESIGRSPALRWLAHALAVLLTFAAVCFAWVFFRSPDVDTALRLAAAMLGLSTGSGVHWVTADILPRLLPYFLVVWLLPNTMQLFARTGAVLHIEDYVGDEPRGRLEQRFAFRPTPAWAVATAVIFLGGWFMISDLSPFIYFQF